MLKSTRGVFESLDDAQDLFLDRVLRHHALPAGVWPTFGSGVVRPNSWPAMLSTHTNMSELSGRPRSRIAASMPHWRKISMVRTQQPRDFGWSVVPRALLDDDAVDAEPVEQQPHRQPDRAAADDEYRRVVHARLRFQSGQIVRHLRASHK